MSGTINILQALIVPSLVAETYILRNGTKQLCLSRLFPACASIRVFSEKSRLLFTTFSCAYTAICSYAQMEPRTQGNRSFHRLCSALDHITNLVIKVVNAVFIFRWVEKAVNFQAGAAAGCVTLAISLYNAKLSYDNLHEIRRDETK